MKFFLFSLIIVSTLSSIEFYAKLEPLETNNIKSEVSGKVIFSNSKIEGLQANNTTIIRIDDTLDKIELKQINQKLKLTSKMIEIEDKNYQRLKNIKTKSVFDKDNQLLKSLNLKSIITDLEFRKMRLVYIIKNKKLIENDRYIYNIYVKKGDYVNPGTLLYTTKDLTKGKLEIFMSINDINNIKNKNIFIDNKRTNLKINKIYKVSDIKNISSYKVEIIIPNPKQFSKLVKINFKNI